MRGWKKLLEIISEGAMWRTAKVVKITNVHMACDSLDEEWVLRAEPFELLTHVCHMGKAGAQAPRLGECGLGDAA